MRNMLMAGAASVALFGATQAMAVDLNLGGAVQPVCEIEGLSNALSFSAMTEGESVNSPTIGIQCNDGDGAEIALVTTEGGMESNDVGDLAVCYDAVLTSSVLTGGPLTLEADATGGADGCAALGGTAGTNDTGTNNKTATALAPGGTALAAGVTDGNLVVTLRDDAVFAGGYADTLQVEITAQ